MTYKHYFETETKKRHLYKTGTDLEAMKELIRKNLMNPMSYRQIIKDSHKKIVFDVGLGSKPVKTSVSKEPTLVEINAKIKADNEAFSAMPLYKQRIEIAKDVLKWINTKKISATTGSYFNLTDQKARDFRNGNPDGSMQDTFLMMEKCDVCAKGALFVCTIARKNEVKNKEIIRWFEPDSLNTSMKGVFSKHQLRLIETEFERSDVEYFYGTKGKRLTPKMDMKNLGPTERLVRIMNNIIANKGWFRPKLG